MSRWLPDPVAFLGLLLLWLMLAGSVAPGALLLGAVLAIAGAATLKGFGLPPIVLRRVLRVPALLLDVLAEVIRSNNAVTWIILRQRKGEERHPGFVTIPLDMRDPYGLAALACILTATPGTVWVAYDSTRHTMLLHVLDLIDEEAWLRIVKDRWERQLMEIFE